LNRSGSETFRHQKTYLFEGVLFFVAQLQWAISPQHDSAMPFAWDKIMSALSAGHDAACR
jgi:hypothetical protein